MSQLFVEHQPYSSGQVFGKRTLRSQWVPLTYRDLDNASQVSLNP
ncbi:MAG: hypothetical protein AAGA75_09690 [Cyanobacteria bacterium P01_E01_bin.6]